MAEWTSVTDELPKSQKRVLIAYSTDSGKRLVTIGWYAARHTLDAAYFEGEVDDEYDEASDTYYVKEGWVDESVESEYHYPISNVTHWAMLPELPEPAAPARDDKTADMFSPEV